MIDSDEQMAQPVGDRPAAAGKIDKLTELAEANKRLKRKIFDLYTVFEISKHLNSVLNTEALLDGIILTCIGQMGVNGAAIFIAKDHLSNDLTMAQCKGLKLVPAADVVIPENSPVIELFQGSHAKPLSYGEIKKRAGDLPEVELLGKLECEYLIPMALQNQVRGLLSVTRKISGTEFFEDDLEFLAILANQLSVAIDNARLFDSEKEALEKLKQTQKQLVQTEKLAALAQLSARVAHEVNNPLGIIKNYLEITRAHLAADQESAEHLQVVAEEVDRIAGIVRQLLSMFRPRQEQFAEIDLETVLDETLLLMSIQIQKSQISIEKQLPDSLPRINGSAEQLKQVFLNLLMNACDFTPVGGKMSVVGTLGDGNLTLTFTDSGPGIPPENLAVVFEPFFTTKSSDQGTGLGLSVCYGIIKAHGGTISVDNAPEGGARFTINLPVRTADE